MTEAAKTPGIIPPGGAVHNYIITNREEKAGEITIYAKHRIEPTPIPQLREYSVDQLANELALRMDSAVVVLVAPRSAEGVIGPSTTIYHNPHVFKNLNNVHRYLRMLVDKSPNG